MKSLELNEKELRELRLSEYFQLKQSSNKNTNTNEKGESHNSSNTKTNNNNNIVKG